jgi:hypothetical protein
MLRIIWVLFLIGSIICLATLVFNIIVGFVMVATSVVGTAIVSGYKAIINYVKGTEE